MSALHNIPAWAEEHWAPKKEENSLELMLLRDFYAAWEAHAAVPNDKLHRNKNEAAAKRVMEAVTMLRRFHKPGVLDEAMKAHEISR